MAPCVEMNSSLGVLICFGSTSIWMQSIALYTPPCMSLTLSRGAGLGYILHSPAAFTPRKRLCRHDISILGHATVPLTGTIIAFMHEREPEKQLSFESYRGSVST